MSEAHQYKIFFLLQRAAHKARSVSDKMLLDKHGITTAQSAVLMMIRNDDGINQKQIAANLRQRESAVTAMVTRLIKAGLVKKTKSEIDQRVWVLALTNEGSSVLKEGGNSFRQVNKQLDAAMEHLNVEDLAKALDQISKLR